MKENTDAKQTNKQTNKQTSPLSNQFSSSKPSCFNPITLKRYNAITILVVFLLCLTSARAHAELRNNMPADVVVGQKDFTSGSKNQDGTDNPKANSLNRPQRVSSDGKRLFISDFLNNRVLIYNSIPTTNGAPADVVIGQTDFTTATSGTTQSKLRSQVGVSSDGKRLFIADFDNHRVLIYNSIPTTNGAPADVVIGQTDFTTRTSGTTQTKLNEPHTAISDGKRLFIADHTNQRILIYNSIPTTNGAPADVVIGQTDFTTATSGTTQSKFNNPKSVFSDGKRLFIADYNNHRVLIYNTIPTTNGAPADVVIGQTDFTTATSGTTQNKLNGPYDVFSDGKKFFVTELGNHRVLIYNSIPTTNGASADMVIGQTDFIFNLQNQDGTNNPKANSLWTPAGVFSDGKRLFIVDYNNNRVLIYNIGGSSIELGPQFEQGKAVLGKVFNDKDGDGFQDQGETGIEGVKVASDTGIYAITDSDGKYHFPYIETGQHLLKVDPVTLPEGATFTTDNPYKVTVTKGILTKVSFGVKLPQEPNNPITQVTQKPNNEPLLKVSITQDPVMLKPRLAISATQDKENIIFDITCNYFLFIEKSKLNIYNQNYKLIKSITLPQPIPSKYTLPISDLNESTNKRINGQTVYYQLCVYDKQNKEDRTGVGSFELK